MLHPSYGENPVSEAKRPKDPVVETFTELEAAERHAIESIEYHSERIYEATRQLSNIRAALKGIRELDRLERL